MRKNLRKNQLLIYLVTLVLAGMTGVLVMSYEILAGRIIAPLLGSSIYTWSAIIAMVLIGATIGLWLGAWIPRRYAGVVLPISYLCAALAIAAAWAAQPLLREFIAASSFGLPMLSILVAAVLCLPQAMALSVGGPLFIVFITESIEQVGKRYSALSIAGSVGSIAGVFLGGYYFVPLLGVTSAIIVLVCAGVLMAVLSLALAATSTSTRVLALGIGVLIGSTVVGGVGGNSSAVFVADSPYYHIQVYDVPHWLSTPTRWLFLDFDSHSIETYGVPTGLYTNLVQLIPHLRPQTDAALILGAGAYDIPKQLTELLPDGSRIDVYEIDRELEAVAQEYFGLEPYTQITTTVGDPRYLLPKTNERYGLIISDTFNSFISVPSHHATVEYFSEVRRHLEDDGIFMMNFIATGEKGGGYAIVQHLVATATAVFGDVRTLALSGEGTGVGNFFIIATPATLPHSNTELEELIHTKIPPMSRTSVLNVDTAEVRLLTDQWQPLESLMRPVLDEYFHPYKRLYYEVTG